MIGSTGPLAAADKLFTCVRYNAELVAERKVRPEHFERFPATAVARPSE
jgi:hypothetical protein